MAPSPTGPFHVGSARTALFNYLFARHHAGAFVLRIEDTDLVRSTPESLQSIYDGLRWLGLGWDEGPGRGGELGPYLQSERLPLYREFVSKLLTEEKAYHCYCTSEELEVRREALRAAGKETKYDGKCKDLAEPERSALEQQGRKSAVRFRMPSGGQTRFTDMIRGEVTFDNSLLDDFVILKSDGFPTYNFAAVVDDAMMRISHVIRGEDGISNTPRQLLLYESMGLPIPQFAHLPLLLGKDRSKLSKRHGSTALSEFRDNGILPEAMLNFLALLGWSRGEQDAEEILSREELIERFDIASVNKSGAVFDLEKLEWMNGHYLRSTPLEKLVELALPYLRQSGLVGKVLSDSHRRHVRNVLALVQERIRYLSDVPSMTAYFFCESLDYDEKAVSKAVKDSDVGQRLEALSTRLEGLREFTKESIEQAVRSLAEELGISAGKLIHPTRAAVTGQGVGPGLFELMEVLGREKCLYRIAAFRSKFLSDAVSG